MIRRKLDHAPRRRVHRTEDGGIKVEPYKPRACKNHRRESTVSVGGVPLCDECFASVHPLVVTGPTRPLPVNPAHADYKEVRADYLTICERAEKARSKWRRDDDAE